MCKLYFPKAHLHSYYMYHNTLVRSCDTETHAHLRAIQRHLIYFWTTLFETVKRLLGLSSLSLEERHLAPMSKGKQTCAATHSPMRRGPRLDLRLCCHLLEILKKF